MLNFVDLIQKESKQNNKGFPDRECELVLAGNYLLSSRLKGTSMSIHFEELLRTIDILRAPGGCPWDRKQKLSDAARYLLDEAGELFESERPVVEGRRKPETMLDQCELA